MVKTPSCATNVSDHSSIGQCGTLMVFLIDLPREIELFLLLSCALTPTLRTSDSTGAISSDILLSVTVPFGLVGSILNVLLADEVEVAELLLLPHGDSEFQSFSSIVCIDIERFGHGKQILRKSALCSCLRILAELDHVRCKDLF